MHDGKIIMERSVMECSEARPNTIPKLAAKGQPLSQPNQQGPNQFQQ